MRLLLQKGEKPRRRVKNQLDKLSRELGEPAVTDRYPLGVTQPSGITEALRTTVASEIRRAVSRLFSLYSI